MSGNAEVASELVVEHEAGLHGVSLRAVDKVTGMDSGWTTLHASVSHGTATHEDMLSAMNMNSGADLNVPTNKGV